MSEGQLRDVLSGSREVEITSAELGHAASVSLADFRGMK